MATTLQTRSLKINNNRDISQEPAKPHFKNAIYHKNKKKHPPPPPLVQTCFSKNLKFFRKRYVFRLGSQSDSSVLFFYNSGFRSTLARGFGIFLGK